MLRRREAVNLKCRLIFYAARKTSFCERALQKSFSALDLELSGTFFSTTAEDLGARLTNAFSGINIVFVVGGLGISGPCGTTEIISKALSDISTDDCKKLSNAFGDDGYVIRAQNQILVLLPDEPEQIEVIMQGPVGKYITVHCKA